MTFKPDDRLVHSTAMSHANKTVQIGSVPLLLLRGHPVTFTSGNPSTLMKYG
ncbi:MAG: hypothetical protein ABI380_07130 [Edaphobacter sp.]